MSTVNKKEKVKVKVTASRISGNYHMDLMEDEPTES